jgi:hypothetical protein
MISKMIFYDDYVYTMKNLRRRDKRRVYDMYVLHLPHIKTQTVKNTRRRDKKRVYHMYIVHPPLLQTTDSEELEYCITNIQCCSKKSFAYL